MFTTKDVNRQRVREQDYQEARNDFNKSARHDLMVKNMMDSEDRTMQKRWMQQRYEVKLLFLILGLVVSPSALANDL